MATTIVITGQLRSPGLLLRIVEDALDLADQGRCERVVVSTWANDLERLPWLADTLNQQRVTVLGSPPIALDTYRNYRRQQHLLEVALDGMADDDVVVKIRPDWVVSREHLAMLCAEPSPTSSAAGRVPLQGRVRIPWWSTRVPFHLADESMSGFVRDLRRFNPADARLALADPHAGRYLPYLMRHMPVLRFVDEHFLGYIAEAQPDPPEVIEALSGPHQDENERAKNQQIGPHRFDVTTMALDLPSYQRALACYVATVDYFFEIFNPTPHLDQFIERHGPWAGVTSDVNTTGDPFRSPDPICYLPEFLAGLARSVPGAFEEFHTAWREYRAEPARLAEPADEDQADRDAAELQARVDRYRKDRLRLTDAGSRDAPESFRRQALDKDSGPRFATLTNIYRHAEKKLPADAWAFIAGGASGEQTLSDNQAAFEKWCLRPRQLSGVVEVDTRTQFIGIELAAPLLTAPIGCDLLFHPDGQRAIVRAAARTGIAPVVAEASYWSLEAAAAESEEPKIMQLHAWGSTQEFLEIAQRAEDAGFSAIALTVDCPTLGWRERSLNGGFQVDPCMFGGNHSREGLATHLLSDKGSDWTWGTVAKTATDLNIPLIVKGVLTADDAEQAVESGASAVIVSNHGGRQLDTVPATLDQMSEVVEAVDGRIAVGIDGGVRRGTDILKALALGADVVLVGRPVAVGLGAAGESGARQVLALLIDEFKRSMLLAGCGSINEITADLIQPRRTS